MINFKEEARNMVDFMTYDAIYDISHYDIFIIITYFHVK